MSLRTPTSLDYKCKKTDNGNVPYFGNTKLISGAYDSGNNVTYIAIPGMKAGTEHQVKWRIEKRRKVKANKCGKVRMGETTTIKHVGGISIDDIDIADLPTGSWDARCPKL